MGSSPSDTALFGIITVAILASGLGVFAVGTHSVATRPTVNLWVTRIAIAAGTVLFLGLILWAGLGGDGG
ncbi:hypothetical protein GA0070216_1385 [Micromonospora matsumotoense]|uniref:Uncharacterized protein n=1 Tax=Micromonospora matsumotoense TaxID=121616 RepID=A0A1C5AX11_9ACTN|nr:hypothetical protein [Micromonospora matsumotoense]SCF49775.1 hypothetical protein GA0070216_1385 [Micromonospora matsumotoense]